MDAMRVQIGRFAEDEGGATAIEYGLIAAMIAVAVIVAMTVAGNGVANLFIGVEQKATAVFDEADV